MRQPALPPNPLPLEALIILGAVIGRDGHPGRVARFRLQFALPLSLETYPDSFILISGGRQPGRPVSEAQAMARWLLEQAAALYGESNRQQLAARLILEEKSRNTAASARHTAQLLLQRQLHSSGLITDTLHMPRANYLFQQVFRPLGLSCIPMPAAGLWQDYWRRRRFLRLCKFLLREAGAWTKVWGQQLFRWRQQNPPASCP